MFVGRELELRRISALLAAARAGHGGALVVRGEAGIGKTALLRIARELATDMLVVSACGLETEAHLAFGALLQLLEPVLDRRASLPAPQAAALEGALALGPPAPGDRLAVCTATLGLLRAAAESAPVLVLLDDMQWIDAASAECLGFAARRLGGSRVATLMATREVETAADALEALPELPAGPLAPETMGTLLADVAPDLAGRVRESVLAIAAGNPLALIEVASQLTAEERSGRLPLPEPLRPAGRASAVFDRRIAQLSLHGQAALLVAATAGEGDLTAVRSACEAMGVESDALEEAESARLVDLSNGRVRFVHPLVRSAAYHRAPPARAREAHRALANVVGGDRRAWHLAAATTGPDEIAAGALQEAGAAAAARRGYAEAADAYERAAALSADLDQRAKRLLRACNSHIVAGAMDRAAAVLDAVVALDAPASHDPRVLQTRAILLIGTGQFTEGFALVKNLAEAAVAFADPVLAGYVLADAAMAALIVGDCRDAAALGERAAGMLSDASGARIRSHVLAARHATGAFRGQASAAREALDDVVALVAQLDPLDWSIGVRTHALTIHLCNALEEYERGRAVASAVLAILDEAGAVGARANPLCHAADSAYRMGAWDVAWREAAEAIALAEEVHTDETLVRGLVARARLLAARGLEAEARADAARAVQIAGRCGIGTIPPYARAALGFLELGLGHIDAAVAQLAPLDASIDADHGLIHPSIIPWRTDFCEALLLAGDHAKAQRQVDVLNSEAEIAGGAAGLALAARCRGLLATDFDAEFAAALSYDDRRPMPFERARTLLAYGSRLHRARRRSEARRVLGEAEEILTTLGALPWAERVAAELAAAGAARRAPRAARQGALSAQEIRVASVMARGLTIREGAAELFLSPKTVDFHLQQIYGKLAIRSRAELALVASERGWLAAGDGKIAAVRT